MGKLLVGLLKGAVIGAGVGFGAYQLHEATGFYNGFLTFGVVGALVGLICGQAIWSLLRDSRKTNIVGILKAAVGFGIGCGLYALVAKAIKPTVMIGGQNVFAWPVSLGGAIGAIYGAFVELDDSVEDAPAAKGTAAKPAAKKLPAGKKKPSIDDIEV